MSSYRLLGHEDIRVPRVLVGDLLGPWGDPPVRAGPPAELSGGAPFWQPPFTCSCRTASSPPGASSRTR